MSVKAARNIYKTHRPTKEKPNVCPECTSLGVGDHQGDVPWRCTPCRDAVRVLVAVGRYHPSLKRPASRQQTPDPS
jgi:hypothetical protein